MKTCSSPFPWLVAALLLSCSAKTEQPSDIQPLPEEITLVATTDGEFGTRTMLDADYTTLTWMPHETISVFRGGKMAKFSSDNQERTTSTTFRGTFPENAPAEKTFYGLYPYDPKASISNGIITTTLPAEQIGTEGSFADKLFISVGRTDSDEIRFSNVCSGIRFMLDRDDIRSVTLLSNGGEPLAGRFSIGFDKSGKTTVNAVTEGISEVRLSAPNGEAFQPGVWYYLVTLPASLEKGYTLLLEGDSVQGTLRSSLPISLNRNKFRSAHLDASRVDFKPEKDYDIVQSGVRAYLENVDYSDDPDYTRSEVSKYSGSDKPMPVKLSWEGEASAIRMSMSPDLASYREIPASSSPASVYNLIPGVRYFYSVVGADGSILRESCVIPKGPVRMIYGVSVNVRDLGGWKAGDKTLRYGMLYRGGRLDDIQSDASAKAILLDDLCVGIELDLRGLPPGTPGGSSEYNPWLPDDPIQYVNIQLWNYFIASTSQWKIPDIAEGVSADQYQYAIRSIIGWLRDGKPVYFHCHGGSDRTGTLAFLIEALLGVSENDLSKDFELTYYSGSNRKRNGSSGWFYKPMVKYIRTFAPTGTIQDQVTAWAKTRHSDEVDPLTDEEIEELKSLLLE